MFTVLESYTDALGRETSNVRSVRNAAFEQSGAYAPQTTTTESIAGGAKITTTEWTDSVSGEQLKKMTKTESDIQPNGWKKTTSYVNLTTENTESTEGEWGRCVTSVSYTPGGNALTTSVQRVQLTGLGLAGNSKSISVDADGNTTVTTESRNPENASKVVASINTALGITNITHSIAGYETCSSNSLGGVTEYFYDGFARKVRTTNYANGHELKRVISTFTDKKNDEDFVNFVLLSFIFLFFMHVFYLSHQASSRKRNYALTGKAQSSQSIHFCSLCHLRLCVQ
ncbi:MAG: hypothetical protein PHO37_17020 [Kiritimatiellae bacterium]|nr:hypothetical protein [Kiritimatiellia bacterium]